MKQTRRPEDEEQLNKTPETPAAPDAPQEEPAYSLEEIMNEFGGWTKRDAPAPAEPVTDETVRLAVPAAEAKGEEKPAEPPAGGDTIRFTPVEEEKEPEPERPAVWTYRGEPDPERPAPDPKEAKELARAERREKRQAEKRRRQLERFQKKEARKKRAQEQPEHTFASPEAAYAFYAAASGTRLRLLVSTLLCLGSVLLLVLSTPLITGAFSDHAAVFSAAMLGLLLLQAVCSYDVCLSGVIALLRFRFDQYSMLFLALCAVVADAFFAVAEGRTPFCTVASILLLLALWGRDLLYDARRRSLRAISNMDEPVAAIREEKAWHGYDCIFRAPGDAEQFAVQLEMPDAGSRIMRVWAPVMTAVTLALSVLTSLRTGEHFLWAWSAMLLASFPAGILIAYAKPFSALARRLYRAGAAIAGWQGARILSGEAGLIVEDADLFPPQNVTQGGMKLYGSRPAPMVIAFSAILIGLLFILTPQTSADVICYVAGILLLASGIAAVVSYLASGRLFGSYALVSGIVLLVGGVFCLLRPEVIQGLLTVIFGVFLVIDGMVTLQDGIDCARAKLGGWWVLAALAVITIALGCVVLFGNFDSIMLLAGISLIVDGVFDLIATLAFSKRVREARQKLHMYMGGPIIDSEKVDD